MLYGRSRVYWDIANPLTVQIFDEAVYHIKDILRPPRFETTKTDDAADMNNFSLKYIRCPTTSSSRLFSIPQRLLAWLPASAVLRKKKTVKENFTADPSSDVMNYVKFTAVMAAAIALKQYLEDKKVLPKNV